LLVAGAAGRSRRLLPAAGVAALCLAALTIQAQPAWAGDASLWSRTVERSPGHWRGHAWLGVTALQADDAEAAVEHLETASRLAPTDAKTHFRRAEALEIRAARTGGDAVVEATRRARDAYAAAIRHFPEGRQENRAILEPLARLRALDLTLALGEIDRAAAMLTRWLDGGRPDVPPGGRVLWNRDLARLTRHVEQHLDPQLERPLAPHLRQWTIQP
jgi:tetratricopeptide (TPR) repeat protein